MKRTRVKNSLKKSYANIEKKTNNILAHLIWFITFWNFQILTTPSRQWLDMRQEKTMSGCDDQWLLLLLLWFFNKNQSKVYIRNECCNNYNQDDTVQNVIIFDHRCFFCFDVKITEFMSRRRFCVTIGNKA